jgi:Xaa-Pro aminopeptidase
MAREGVQVFVATSPVTMDYHFGLNEDGGERLLAYFVHAAGKERLICPALTANQARRQGIQEVAEWRDGQDPWPLVQALFEEWGVHGSTVAVEDDCRASVLLGLMGVSPTSRFVTGNLLVAEGARVKDAEELGRLREAGRFADQAFEPVLARLEPGITETEVARLLAAEMSALGGTPVFAIVATGPNGAEPHHHSDATPLESGHIVILDFGCDYKGYKSDITRTVCLGHADQEASDVYGVVYEAFMAARREIGPGIPASAVDRAARSVIEKAGYGEFFVHRTGHGLGMRIHEEPYIRQGNDEPLRVGEVFSVEPGIYLPGRFGVRIENIVTVTESGHECLNEEPSPTLRQASSRP